MARTSIPPSVAKAIAQLASADRAAQGDSYRQLQEAVNGGIGWADEAWPQVVPLLGHKDNRVRSIAGQTLCELAPRASAALVKRDLDKLVKATHDERFVTARHILLALWSIGQADAQLRKLLLAKLSVRSAACATEKNGTLMRHDIHCALRRLFDATADPAVKVAAEALLPHEPDEKYRKKNASVWKGA